MNSEALLTSEPKTATVPEPRLARPTSSLDLSPLMILMTVGLVSATIVHRQQLMYSPNDSSRWNTVYYLSQHGTYEYLPVRDVKWATRGTKEGQPLPLWDTPVLWTIDMIRVDGKMYSSKPPLLPTVLAGIAWTVGKVTGQTFHNNPWFIERAILIIAQVIPFAIMLVLIRRNVFRASESPFVRHFVMAAACFGTLLTPWLVALNNHVIAAATGLIALDAVIRIWYEDRREWYWFAIAGFFAAFTACIELPAGLLAVVLFALLLVKDYRRTLIMGLVPALIPTVAALYTNHIVTGQLMPAYEQIDTPGGFYDYPDSYWGKRTGIDALDEPKHIYLAHMLIGHDGFFSLTPILLVALAGMILELSRHRERELLAGMTLAMTVAIIAVYVKKTNNYGGGCQGFRWLFWVLPMWLLFLPAGVEWFASKRASRYVLYGLLAISVFSVGFAYDNPFTQNWIRLLMNKAGIINY